MSDTIPVRLALLGSTGSIGRQTLDVVRSLGDRFSVVALAAGRNRALFEQQVAEFKPAHASLADGDGLALDELAVLPEADIVVIATSGTAGMKATCAAAQAGKTIALANKESLVAAGELITAALAEAGGRILPVDSEHSAIWQCLAGEPEPRRIYLTASGGPFRTFTRERMAAVTPDEALAHPSWTMGPKITIDSATLLNKGLEVIEAKWLFGVDIDAITVVVHPQSIVHSMVEFADGSVKAQLGCPDMRLPIQYALTWPARIANDTLPALDWAKVAALTFETPDLDRFPCLRLAIEAGKKGGTHPAVLCAAGEVAVDLFLNRKVPFAAIARLVEDALAQHAGINKPALEDILGVDAYTRDYVRDLAGRTAWD